jgi:hypothetical protein
MRQIKNREVGSSAPVAPIKNSTISSAPNKFVNNGMKFGFEVEKPHEGNNKLNRISGVYGFGKLSGDDYVDLGRNPRRGLPVPEDGGYVVPKPGSDDIYMTADAAGSKNMTHGEVALYSDPTGQVNIYGTGTTPHNTYFEGKKTSGPKYASGDGGYVDLIGTDTGKYMYTVPSTPNDGGYVVPKPESRDIYITADAARSKNMTHGEVDLYSEPKGQVNIYGTGTTPHNTYFEGKKTSGPKYASGDGDYVDLRGIDTGKYMYTVASTPNDGGYVVAGKGKGGQYMFSPASNTGYTVPRDEGGEYITALKRLPKDAGYLPGRNTGPDYMTANQISNSKKAKKNPDNRFGFGDEQFAPLLSREEREGNNNFKINE